MPVIQMIETKCPECGGKVELDMESLGALCRCPQCRSNFVAPSTRVMAGTSVGEFWIQQRLGSSVRSEVFLAKKLATGSRVALKVFSPLVPFREDAARAYFSIFDDSAFKSSPMVIAPTEIGSVQNLGYISYPYFQGEDLQQYLKRTGVLQETKILEIALSVATSLDDIWQKAECVHGHLNPGNLMLVNKADVMITDFGINRVLLNAEPGAVNRDSNLSSYRSPEQIRGEELDSRSDIYSLGAVLYHLVTGAKPIAADANNVMLIDGDETLFPPAHDINPNISENFSDILTRMVHLDLDQRYASWMQLINHIKDYQASQLSTQILYPKAESVPPEPTRSSPPGKSLGKEKMKWGKKKKRMATRRRVSAGVAMQRAKQAPKWILGFGVISFLLLAGLAAGMAYILHQRDLEQQKIDQTVADQQLRDLASEYRQILAYHRQHPTQVDATIQKLIVLRVKASDSELMEEISKKIALLKKRGSGSRTPKR